MRTSTWLLLGGLGTVVGLWLYSRTSSGQAATVAASSGLADLGSGISEDLSAVGEALGLTPRGIRNNNPGNLRFIADPARAWDGQVADDSGYGVYSSPAMGVRAMSHQLQKDFAAGQQTLAALIATWAPPSENNTAAYIADVAGSLGVNPNAPFDLYGTLPELAAAITQHENGQQPYAMEDLATWVNS